MALDIDKYIEHEISSHKEILAALCEIISLPFGDLVRESKNVIINNGKIVFFGNIIGLKFILFSNLILDIDIL